MGDNLSVRFPSGKDPNIKVGTDEVIFKVTTYTHIEHIIRCSPNKVYTHDYVDVTSHPGQSMTPPSCAVKQRERTT